MFQSESENQMRPNRILHPELARAVASVGHSDIVLVTDAGFPIPAGAWRIDLAFYQGMPDVLDVLRVLRQEIFVEEVHFAGDILEKNQPLYRELQMIYAGSGATFHLTTHETLVHEIAHRAKVVVRSGSFNPWANIALVCSTDPFAWFGEGSGTEVLPAYVARRQRIQEHALPEIVQKEART
jgi:D-ribose pyranose/furanose isomerase RbsD